MRVLVACEESQAVTKELRRLGHEAYSCDIEPCSGGRPEWHLQVDALELLKMKWDMILAFPPCTHLAVSGARYFEEKRKDGRQQAAIDFFMQFTNADCPKIAIENPVGIMSSVWRKPDQIIQPWQFGHGETKKTCLWLKGLPLLKPTDVLDLPKNGWKNQSITKDGRYGGFKNFDESGKLLAWNDKRTARIRSKTYSGVAKAMAEQWAGDIRDGEIDGITTWR